MREKLRLKRRRESNCEGMRKRHKVFVKRVREWEEMREDEENEKKKRLVTVRKNDERREHTWLLNYV